MINKKTEYGISCDDCFEPLIYPSDHPLTSYRGHVLTEDTSDHIRDVAKSYGWKIKNGKNLCPSCYFTPPTQAGR